MRVHRFEHFGRNVIACRSGINKRFPVYRPFVFGIDEGRLFEFHGAVIIHAYFDVFFVLYFVANDNGNFTVDELNADIGILSCVSFRKRDGLNGCIRDICSGFVIVREGGKIRSEVRIHRFVLEIDVVYHFFIRFGIRKETFAVLGHIDLLLSVFIDEIAVNTLGKHISRVSLNFNVTALRIYALYRCVVERAFGESRFPFFFGDFVGNERVEIGVLGKYGFDDDGAGCGLVARFRDDGGVVGRYGDGESRFFADCKLERRLVYGYAFNGNRLCLLSALFRLIVVSVVVFASGKREQTDCYSHKRNNHSE